MDVIALLSPMVLAALWFFIGRNSGRSEAQKAAAPYRELAGPIFRALRVDGAERVVVVVTRTSDDEWTASQHTTVVKAETSPDD
jgi:hypothetical protein